MGEDRGLNCRQTDLLTPSLQVQINPIQGVDSIADKQIC
jgi:hypothetical protein